MKIEDLHKLFLENPAVCTDTRNIKLNSLFFALKGDNFNGNEFALKALESGASFSVVDEEKFAVGSNCILVDNVLQTLQELAQFHRMKFEIPVIAVTGSNGKTTSKELINVVLSKKYNVAYTKGNLNNHIGVPLTLLDLTTDHEIALIEMGDNHPKEVEFLCEIAKPNYGFVTNVGKDHLEGFGSFEKNVLAKKEVFDYLESVNGKVFLDVSDELVSSMVGDNLDRVTYGVEESDSFIEYVSSSPLVVCKTENGEIMTSNLFGSFNFNNIKLAFSIGTYFKVDQADISDAISSYLPDNNRSQVVITERNTLVMDAYNANPSSVEEAVNSFSNMDTDMKKWVVLGDMFELGKYSAMEHQNMATLAISKGLDKVILVGENFARVPKTDGALVYGQKADAEVYIKKIAPEGAIILLKGSRGMQLETFKKLF